jgi:hypothetical protein
MPNDRVSYAEGEDILCRKTEYRVQELGVVPSHPTLSALIETTASSKTASGASRLVKRVKYVHSQTGQTCDCLSLQRLCSCIVAMLESMQTPMTHVRFARP